MNQLNPEVPTSAATKSPTEVTTSPIIRVLYEKPRLEIHEGYTVLVGAPGSI